MKKLSFEALQAKAAHTNQEELLNSVSGGTFGDCHPCDYQLNSPSNTSTIDDIHHYFTCDEH